MANAFKCDVCGSFFELQPLKNFVGGKDEKNVQANLRLFMFDKHGNRVDEFEQWDLCPECYKKLKQFLNENVEKETFEEVDTDVKKMTTSEAREILKEEWCCECKRYSNNVCDMIIPSGTKSCVDCILENLTPLHFRRK